MFATIAGIGLIAAALGMGLFGAHVSERHAWDRPHWTLSRAFRLLWHPVRRTLLAAGLAIVWLESPVLAIASGAALIVLWIRLAWVRSTRFAVRSFEKSVEIIRAESPGLSEPECLCRVILSRHPDWGPELAEQIVRDHPTVRSAARIVARMEQGWRQV